MALKNLNHIKALILLLIICTCCKKSEVNTVTDIDGNIYHTLQIGKQVWMVENLKVAKFRNGDAIQQITGDGSWCATNLPAYCFYNNDTANKKYGALYNWYAISDSRNIAPEGWHIPTNDELNELINYLGGETIAGGKMKITGSGEWVYPNIYGTNFSGFSALPGGYRYTNSAANENTCGTFQCLGSNGYWWTQTMSYQIYSWNSRIYFGFANVERELRDNTYGFSVRCIKDK